MFWRRLHDAVEAGVWVWRWWNPAHKGPYVGRWHPGPDNRWPIPYEQALAARQGLLDVCRAGRRNDGRKPRTGDELTGWRDAWGIITWMVKRHFRAMGVYGHDEKE